ncbi:sensor histidine kinase [Terriglobus sp.]|uniref:sensor histidine kinase n=1 Tax=Terriglobus sp. TaxID=1889013 RepID=UPI003AFFACBF
MKAHSLARRAVLIVLVTQMLSTLALGAAALLKERNSRLHTFDLQLEGRSDSLLGAIQDAEDPEDNVTVDSAELHIPKDDAYAVYNQNGRLLGASAGVPNSLIARRTDGYRNLTAGGTSYRVYQREALRVIDRAETQGVGLKRPVTIIYGSPDNRLRHEIFEAVRFYLVAVVLAGVCTAGVVTLFLRKELQPLNELAVVASGLTPRTLRFEAPASARKIGELQPLIRALTAMVASLRHAFAREQKFFGDAAHELKTAIAVVRSSVQVLMLRERTVKEYQSGLLGVLDDSTRVEKLVAQMLRLASASEDTNREKVELINFTRIASEVCSNLEPVAALRGVILERHLEPLSAARLLPEDAYTLVSNLVLNAIQHSRPESSVEVLVTMVGSRLDLQVRDDGAGISEAALPHIFERFYREDTSRSRETGGTGLGLSICKAIVDAAEGSIKVSSTRGKGTTMHVTFAKP